MSQARKSWVGGLTRIGAGVIAAAAIVVAGGAAVGIPWPGHTRDALSVQTSPEASDSVASCSGAILALGRDAANASAISAAAAAPVVSGVVSGGSSARQVMLDSPDVHGKASPLALEAAPDGRVSTLLAAAQSGTAHDDDLRGFAASACTAPQMESWIVGGSAATGAADMLILTNPGTVAASVDVTVYGASGKVGQTAGTDILVPPATQRVIPLAAFALGEASPILQVTSADSPVVASVQSSITRTLTPGGVDVVGAGPAPTGTVVIPAVSVTRAPGDVGASEEGTLVRMLAPARDADASVTITPVGGGSARPTQKVHLSAGKPLELDLSAAPIGTYTVQISADAPIVAGAWETTGFDAGSDFAWYAPTSAFSEPTLVAIAQGKSPRLTIVNSGSSATEVAIADRAGAGSAVTVAVAAHRAVSISVRAGELYRIDPHASIRANVTYSARDALASYPVTPGDGTATSVTVHPR